MGAEWPRVGAEWPRVARSTLTSTPPPQPAVAAEVRRVLGAVRARAEDADARRAAAAAQETAAAVESTRQQVCLWPAWKDGTAHIQAHHPTLLLLFCTANRCDCSCKHLSLTTSLTTRRSGPFCLLTSAHFFRSSQPSLIYSHRRTHHVTTPPPPHPHPLAGGGAGGGNPSPRRRLHCEIQHAGRGPPRARAPVAAGARRARRGRRGGSRGSSDRLGDQGQSCDLSGSAARGGGGAAGLPHCRVGCRARPCRRG